jgi:glycosyltransferase involved in cell wall biosynthesis
MKRRVCIVGSGNLASNPRLLKEADALHGEGYDVTAVACDYTDALRAADDEIARRVPWQVRRVPRPLAGRYTSRVARLAVLPQAAAGLPVPMMLASEAYGGPARALRRATIDVPAELYIAHYVPSLPAACAAARRHGAMLSFDAEDFHSGEGAGGTVDSLRMAMVRQIEGAILPSCAYVTTSAPMIGRAYAERYGIAAPTTVLNVFPLDMAPAEAAIRVPGEAGRLRAYWFSQTIGLDRGLQAFIRAMARSQTDVTLDIRGSNRWGHGDALLGLARELGIGAKVRILDLAPPQDMVRLAATYDLGLSLETDVNESRRLCLTNKIFTYLMAGVPAMLSDTPAQASLAAELGQAAILVSLARPNLIAAEIDRISAAPALAASKAAASRLARQRYNWDLEKHVMLKAVEQAFARFEGNGAR